MADTASEKGSPNRALVNWLWATVVTIVLGTLGSMTATALFDWRLPPWLTKPAPVEAPATTENAKDADASEETVIDWWPTGFVLGAIGTVVAVIIGVIIHLSLPDVPKEPDVRDYRKDSFFGLTWRWRYGATGDIEDIACFCPICDRQLKIQEVDRWPFVYTFTCAVHGERHRHRGSWKEFLADAVREIHLNIRNANWRKKVAPPEEGSKGTP